MAKRRRMRRSKRKVKKTRRHVLYLLVAALILAGIYSFYHQKIAEKAIDPQVVLLKKAVKLDDVTLPMGTSLVADRQSGSSYHVTIYQRSQKHTGYVSQKNVLIYHYDASFENNIALFPDSYKQLLRNLHALYPQWIFMIKNVPYSFDYCARVYQTKALTTYTDPSMIASSTVLEGSSWRRASLSLVRFVLDPRNSLIADRACVFERLSYNSEETLGQIEKMLKGTYLAGTDPLSHQSYATLLKNACLKYNMSLSNIATRAKQENGGGGIGVKGAYASGDASKKYYNIFNIGANTGAQSGIDYAKRQGWDTREKAINGGVAYIASHYKNQMTLYEQRFDLGSRVLNTNVYMLNITAPMEEAKHMMNSYLSVDSDHVSRSLSIPVFKNMPGRSLYPHEGTAYDLSLYGDETLVPIRNVQASYKKVNKYTGKEIRPSIRLTYGKLTLREGIDYVVSYENNKQTGQGTIVIKGLNKFTGMVNKTFTIE